MAAPNVTFLTLADVCERWRMKPLHVGAMALDGKLTLSVGLAGVYAEIGEWLAVDVNDWQRIPEGRRRLTGVYDLYRGDAWGAIKEGSQVIDSVMLPGNASSFADFDVEGQQPEVVVTIDELLVRYNEVVRFETENAIIDNPASGEGPSRGGPGAPTRFDWDGFWVEACRRVHDEGLPGSQAAMIRDLLDWFDNNGPTVPEQSTVKKKVSRLWKARLFAVSRG